MVAQLRQFSTLELYSDPVDAQLFADERRLHDEVARFLAFAARHAGDDSLRAQLKPILNVSGKRIRPLLPFWLQRAFGVAPEIDRARADAAQRVAAVTLVLHSAAIVIDDIEDGSLERQSQAALHLRHGLGPTLNAASLLIFAALEYLGDPSLIALTVEAVSRCHVGQALDLAFGDPRVAGPLLDGSAEARAERWRTCTRYKTSQLMEWSVRAAARVLRLPDAVTDGLAGAIVEYGIGYQILDDIKNLRPDLVGAKAYEDLPRGLRSWVCLELLAQLGPDEMQRARSLYGGFAFAAFVRMHPGLPAAVERSMQAARAHVASAERALVRLTDGRERGYLARLLDRPLEDLRHDG
jgi:geranylgeranyl pyrophosphate synthase